MPKYEYTKISVPKEIQQKAEKVMPLIGCRTMTAFVSLALVRYINQLTKEQGDKEETP